MNLILTDCFDFILSVAFDHSNHLLDKNSTKPIMKNLSYECYYKGKFRKVKKLLESGEDPNESDAQNCTPLHLASKKGLKKIAKLLIKHGANVNAKLNTNSKTPLHEAT